MSKQKKFNDFTDLAKHIFAENPDYIPEHEQKKEFKIEPKEQLLEAHFSKKGRGGKIVTVIKGFEGSEQELKKLGKYIKNKIGVGGSVKNYEIIIQGNNYA